MSSWRDDLGGRNVMEIKFNPMSRWHHITFYCGLFFGAILAKLIYPLDMGLGEVLFKLIKHYAFGW